MNLFDIELVVGRFEWKLGRWIRLLLLLAGDIHPHPGPSRSDSCAAKRRKSLLAVSHVKPHEEALRGTAFNLFDIWCRSELNLQATSLCGSANLISADLKSFVNCLYCNNGPVHIATEAILVVVDRHEQLRWLLTGPWMRLELSVPRIVILQLCLVFGNDLIFARYVC